MEILKDVLSIFAEQFLSVVLPVLVSALAVLAVAKIKQVVANIKAKLSEEMAWALDEAVIAAVNAAEQANLAGYVADKKEYAIDVAQEWLEFRGFKIDLSVIVARVEAAVWTELNRDNPLKNESIRAQNEVKLELAEAGADKQ
jgi:hypothetical protein